MKTLNNFKCILPDCRSDSVQHHTGSSVFRIASLGGVTRTKQSNIGGSLSQNLAQTH